METTSFAIGMVVGSSIIYALNYFLGITSAIKWQEKSEDTILKLLIICLEASSYMQTLKIKTMEEMGVEQNIIKLTKNVDEHTFATWKKSMVEAINVAYLDSFHKFHFYDWDEVMQHAERIWRKNVESRRKNDKQE